VDNKPSGNRLSTEGSVTSLNLKQYNYTAKELDGLLKSMVVLWDSREQMNSHILYELDKLKVQYQKHKLNYGDYSFLLPKNESLGIYRDMYFDRNFVIERKASLEELSANVAQDRQRFENEFMRSSNCRMVLMVENGSYEDILNHKYNTQMNEKAYFASMLTFQHRYGIDIAFVGKELAGKYIYGSFYYYLREFVRGAA
jgi:ERCC4-type nuclease